MGTITKSVAGLLAALMLATVAVGTATATGKDAPLRRCVKGGYDGGVKVFAKDGGKGAGRIICPAPTYWYQDSPDYANWGGERMDKRLGKRNARRPQREDIWNGFSKRIESLEIIALETPYGGEDKTDCWVRVELYGGKKGRKLIFEGSIEAGYPVPARRLLEVPEHKDDKATRVKVSRSCVYSDPCLFGGCDP